MHREFKIIFILLAFFLILCIIRTSGRPSLHVEGRMRSSLELCTIWVSFDCRLPTSSITFLSKLGVFAVLSHRNLGNVMKLFGLFVVVAGLACLLAPPSAQAQIYVTGGTTNLSAPVSGLIEGLVSGTNGGDSTDPIVPFSVQSVARWGASTAAVNQAGPPDMDPTSANPLQWTNNTTIGYSGLIDNTSNAPITYVFSKNFDDNGYVTIDGNSVINDGNWTNNTTDSITLSPGFHSIDVRFGQGGGGAGPNSAGGLPGNNGGFPYNAFGVPITRFSTPTRPARGCRSAPVIQTPSSTPVTWARRINPSSSPATAR